MSYETMRLIVKMINSYTFPVDIHRRGSIGLLKQKISEKINMVPSKQRLIFQGKVLLNDKLLNDYHLEENDVLHLIEQTQTEPQSNGGQQEMTSSSSHNGDDTFNELLSSLFIRNPLMSLNSNTSNASNNSHTINDIPQSFHHLLKQSNFIQAESIETITQATNSLYTMINRTPHLMLNEAPSIKHLYSNAELSNSTNYKVGQWVDIKDSSDQWIEGQVANTRGNEVNVHYLGLTNQLNHWIDAESKRIALFRSFTSQNLNNQFASPFPNKTDANNSLSIDIKDKYSPLNNDLITFFDFIKERIAKLMKQRDAMKESNNSYYRSKEDLLNNERFYYLQLMQLYPLMDRLGKLLSDVSCYLMNMSFKFFEDNIYLFKGNIQDERLSFLDYYVRDADYIRQHEIKEFITLTEYSVLKMKKTEAETRRPVVGLLVNVQRNDRRENSFSANRLSIVNEDWFCVNFSKSKMRTCDKGLQVDNPKAFSYNAIVVLNGSFSIEAIRSSDKDVGTNGKHNVNSTSSKIKKKKPTEKVVLVSRDKPINKKNVNESSNAPKKKYRLSQSKSNTKTNL